MAKNRSRRLRKKLYVDEFQILGFEFSSNLDLVSDEEFYEFFDQFIDFIEQRNLCMGGGGGPDTFSGFITSEARYGSATKDDQLAIEDWLKSKSFVTNVKIGELVDGMHGFYS